MIMAVKRGERREERGERSLPQPHSRASSPTRSLSKREGSFEGFKTFLQLLERAISTQALKVIAHQKLRWGAVHCENITNHRRKAMTIAAARRLISLERVLDR